ncbi:unnamed protein product, partial [Symbiodinium sp. CCMP2456]
NPSPFATPSPGPSACGGGGGGGASASPFGSGGAVASPFSASAGPPQASPFGSGTVSPFAAGGPAQPSASPFGQGGPSASPFAGPGSHAASPFSGNPGGTPAAPSPFGGQGSTPSPFSGAANMGSAPLTPPAATQRSASPFAAGSQAPSATPPFGAQASPFGTSSATVASASPFGGQGAVGPFGGASGASGASSASPFAAQSSSSFAAGACSGASPFAQSANAPATASARAQGTTTSPFAPPAQGSASTSTSPFGAPTSAVASPSVPAGASPFTKATAPVPSAKAGAASKDAKELLPELLRKVDWQLTSFGLDNQACVVTNDTSFEEHRWLMLQQPRGDWGSLSNKLLSESKQKFNTYLSGSADAAAPSQAQDAASASTRAPSPFDGASRSSSPFGASASAGGSAPAGASPFGASTPSPFGAAGTASPFGSQASGTGPFAQRSTSPGPFAATSSPFAPGPSASPFQSSGQGTPPSPFAPSYATASASVPYDAGVRYGLSPLQMRPHEETELAQEDLKAFEAAAFESQKIPEVEPPPSDFLEETSGNKFNTEGWAAPEIGDTVSGTIMYLGEDGAFVELDCGGVKSWAQLPTKLASLKPIVSVKEVGLEVGAKIETVVVEKDLTSVVLGDPTAVQYIVSLSSLELDAAWNKVQRTMDGEEGYDPLWQVQVLQMASWGAQVMTEEGLVGMIPARDLGEKAGDPGMVGAVLTVQIKAVKPENRENTNPQMVSDYPIVFSYADVMKKVLAEKINEGDVVEAKITNFLPNSMDVEIEGTPFQIAKVDISKNTLFVPQELFVIDEIIKVYCLSSDAETGSLRRVAR